MKNGLDRKNGEEPEDQSNVVSFKQARDRAAEKARERAKRGAADSERDRPRITVGQWIIGALFMLLAIGGAIALVRPLVKGAGVASGLGVG
jgi:hypothetical protein